MACAGDAHLRAVHGTAPRIRNASVAWLNAPSLFVLPPPCPTLPRHPRSPRLPIHPRPPAASTTTSTRVREVHIRSLVDFADLRELAQVMLDAVTGQSPPLQIPPVLSPQARLTICAAHKHLYEDAGILRGDINPNTNAIFAFPREPGARSVGGLVDCDEPLRRVK